MGYSIEQSRSPLELRPYLSLSLSLSLSLFLSLSLSVPLSLSLSLSLALVCFLQKKHQSQSVAFITKMTNFGQLFKPMFNKLLSFLGRFWRLFGASGHFGRLGAPRAIQDAFLRAF